MIIMGHRGAAALEPENTLLSIGRAIEIGVNAVEIDVRLSKDKEIVVMHDSTLDRTTDGTGPVCNFTIDELKKLDAGNGQRIPTLQEVIDFIDNKVELVIELKEEGTFKSVYKLIKRNKYRKQCICDLFLAQVCEDCKRDGQPHQNRRASGGMPCRHVHCYSGICRRTRHELLFYRQKICPNSP